MKLLMRFFEAVDPQLDKIETPLVRDVARAAAPFGYGIFWLMVIGMPFTLAGQVINALVQMSKV